MAGSSSYKHTIRELEFLWQALPLENNIRGSLEPSPLQANIMVKGSFLCPMLIIGTDLIPLEETGMFDAMSNISDI